MPTWADERKMLKDAMADDDADMAPRKNSGKGQIDGGTGSDVAAPARGDVDGGQVGTVYHSADDEARIRRKAATGGVIDNSDLDDPHGYLGHFGNDDVLRKGHNTGHKKIGKGNLVQSTSKKGYRVLPGSASPQQGKANYGTMTDTQLGLRPPRFQREADAKLKASMSRAMNKSRVMEHDIVPLGNTGGKPKAVSMSDSHSGGHALPVTPSDKQMSIRHHEDSIRYNRRHAVDHEKAIAKHEKELAQVQRSLKRGKK